MKKKLFDALNNLNRKNISDFIQRNLLMVLLALLLCLGISMSAYLGSGDYGLNNNWSLAITHVPSTPTNTIAPDTGWWSAIATPTPKK